MKKRVVKTTVKPNGTILHFHDGTEEFMEGATVQLNSEATGPMKKPLAQDEEEEDEESVLDGLRK